MATRPAERAAQAARALARRAVTRVRARLLPRAVILLYHRVASPARDPWALAVAPERFDAHMALLRARYRPLPLDDLVHALAAGRRLPARAVCVTFDDGYGDVARAGLLSLERHRVHGTVFVVSGAVGSDREFWWDELERLTLDAGPLPSALTFQVDGREEVLPVLADARVACATRVDERSWRAWTSDHPTPRHALYHALWQRLQPLSSVERARALEALREQMHERSGARADRVPCSEAELRAFHASPYGGVGAHTVSHPELSALPLDEQAREIQGSRHTLQSLLGSPVALFSYPFGHARGYTPDTERLVREAGFTGACLNDGGASVRSGVGDPLRLPRLYVPDWDAATLAWHLDSALGE